MDLFSVLPVVCPFFVISTMTKYSIFRRLSSDRNTVLDFVARCYFFAIPENKLLACFSLSAVADREMLPAGHDPAGSLKTAGRGVNNTGFF